MLIWREEEEVEKEVAVEEIRRSTAESTILDSVCSFITGNQLCTKVFDLATIEGTIAI